MSVIYGRLNLTTPVTIDELSLMENKLKHWTPDDAGKWMKEHVGLGSLMFYNTPESLNEKLPLTKNGLTITADARIDNRDEICLLLNLESDCALPDSTLILMLYEKYSNDCIKHIVGDFAFAIWDEKAEKLFCARDHIGIKPFFYYSDKSFFAFASELKGLLHIPGLNRALNMQFLYNSMFRNSEQYDRNTLYKYISRLEPAHTLTFDLKNNNLKTERYWDMDAVTEIHFDNRDDYYEAFCKEFERAVECRLRTAYPIGIELSGGMDSSGIAGVASSLLKPEGRELIAISNTIPRHITEGEELEKSERRFIDAVVNFNGIKRSVITVSDQPAHPFEDIDFMLYVNDGPDTWQQQWQIPIRQAAQKEGIRTLLSGFPGDEMVTYRGKYYFLDFLDKKQYLKYLFAKREFQGFRRLDPLIPYSIRYRLHTLKNSLGIYNKHVRNARKIYNIPAENIRAKGDVNWRSPLLKEQFKSYRHYQKWRFLRYHLPARMESETRFGLYFGLEPRFPMADIRLTQFYLSLPNYLKYEGDLHRTAYRKALKDYLPQEVLERDNKRGNMTPYRNPEKDENIIKEKAALTRQMQNEMYAALEGIHLIKPQAIKNRQVSTPMARWLQKNWKDQVIE
ncbi:MAG TPA: asparagine synthase-related protein [Mucilaginibacter sp.]